VIAGHLNCESFRGKWAYLFFDRAMITDTSGELELSYDLVGLRSSWSKLDG
jgi:hypothetical protein